MTMKRILLLVCSCLLFHFEGNSVEEIRVELGTEIKLTPIYIGAFETDGSLPSGYERALQQVVERDFKYNGSSYLLPKEAKKELLLHEKEGARAFNRAAWREYGVNHIVTGKIAAGKLFVKALDCTTGILKQFKEVPITGDLSRDRAQMHYIADTLHLAFFGREGIASTRILYSHYIPSQSPNWSSEIWECDWDGENKRQVTRENSYCISPVYVPSKEGVSDSFLYVSYKQGQPKIYKASLREGKGERVVDIRGNQLLPAITFAKDKMAFICDATGRADLFLVDGNDGLKGDEKPLQLFSFPRSTQASPTFSPDGSKLAFVSDKDGPPRIYLITAKAAKRRGEAKLLTRKVREATCPTWSADGRKLAYSAKVENVRQIWIYDFDLSEERQLTTGPGNKENPSWAPDSLHLVFNSVDNGSSELYIVNMNQPEAVKISGGAGKKHYPSWGKPKVGL